MRFFRKKTTPHSIIINRTSALTNNRLQAVESWQPRHTRHTITKSIVDSIVTSTDPLDRALSEYLDRQAATPATQQPLRQLDFDQTHHLSGNVWHYGAEYILALKGMPEQIIERCELSDNERESITLQLQAMSAAGNYIVAFARATLTRPVTAISKLPAQTPLQFVGFVSLSVAVPATTRQLIARLQVSGAAIHVVTGQHPAAGSQIGRQLGIVTQPSDVLDARQLDPLTDIQALVAIRKSPLIARADTDDKVRIHRLLTQADPSTISIDTIEQLRQL